MAVDIETATLEDYRDMMLRPTKLNEIAKVLYDLAQQADGSLIEIGTNNREIEALQARIESAENDISYLESVLFNLSEAQTLNEIDDIRDELINANIIFKLSLTN